MERSYFTRVKDLFANDQLGYLGKLGVEVGKTSQDWTQGKCPLCPDKSGSASFSKEGFLNCHQCGRKADLFEWVAEKESIVLWEALKIVADLVGFNMTPPPRRGRAPKEMSADILEHSVHALWDSDQAKPLRAFLIKRNLNNPQILEMFGVGYLAGSISFAQFTLEGILQPRYRKYTPGGQLKWLWSTGRGPTVGFWPYYNVPKDGVIWIMEGEWDVLVAWIVLKLQNQGIYCFTWTGGAGAPIPAHAVPKAWKRREIHILYDNDTFQGLSLEDHFAPDQQGRMAMERRRTNLIYGVAATFNSLQCKTVIHAVPVDPAKKWGGDFRDWVEEGGRDIQQIPGWPFNKVKQDRPAPMECSFNDVFKMAGKEVRFRAIVNTVEEDGIAIPIHSTIDCAMGTRNVCGSCGVPPNFPTQILPWAAHQEDLAAALSERNFERWVTANVLGKPSSCPRCRIRHAEYKVGCRWHAVQDDPEESGDKELLIISEEMPTLSGEVEIEGTVYFHGTRPVVIASKLRQLDRAEIDLSPYVTNLSALCPEAATETKAIDAFLVRRAHDLSTNVTHIYGREELHIGIELVAHSVIWIKPEHDRVRGWLDVAIIGDTRSGKSMVARRLLTHYGLGEIHTCMENISRAGMTIGAAQGTKNKLKPGLFPRCHRKMLYLDEAHVMVEKSADNPMLHLQSARDVGTVGGVKIYGSRTLAACVRLVAIFNWARGNIRSFQFPCQHLLHLYGAPESLSRMDYAVSVIGLPDPTPEPVAPQWTQELTQVLILRAWSMTEEMIHFSKEARDLAEQVCQDWGEVFTEELPLFTRKEKPYSVLRIAVAIANMTFSHPESKPDECEVRECHVQWAINWLERTWAALHYDELSAKTKSTVEVSQPFRVEKQFTCYPGLIDADSAARIFPEFFGFYSKSKLMSLLGKEIHETERWLSQMIGYGAFRFDKSQNGFHIEVGLTPGGHQILRNLYVLATEYDEEYVRRYRLLDHWIEPKDPKNLSPLSIKTNILRREWDARTSDGHGETNLIPGPGA